MSSIFDGLNAPVYVGAPVRGRIVLPAPPPRRVIIKPRIPLDFWRLVAAYLKSKISE